ncbi:MAG: SRPBCC family protein [Candidatus Binatia bacterium]
MSEHVLTREMVINLPRPQVFDFFADAGNLERITPPELKFNIFTPLPVDLRDGALIEYRLSVHGFPINWRTEISLWDPPFEFIDRELKGPYKQWIHRHTFVEMDDNKTLIKDEVRYRLPVEPFGDLFHWCIRAKLDHIFDFRERAVREILEDRAV